MNNKPVILISGEHGISAENMGFVPVYLLDKAYSRSITAAGGIPVTPLGPCMEDAYIEIADGLLLSGGANIHSGRYNTPFFDEESASNINYYRDNIEFDLFESFFNKGKPIMGIGRGQQLINVALGGTLVQNIYTASAIQHAEKHTHLVKSEPGSIMRRLFGSQFQTNSYHQQAVDKLGCGLKITARSHDDIPEALEHKNKPVISVQFHPESMNKNVTEIKPDMKCLFDHFVKLCLADKSHGCKLTGQ